MKKNALSLLLLFTVLFSHSLPAYSQNLIINGDFSNDLTNWTAIAINGPLSVKVRSTSACAPFHTNGAAAFDVFSTRRSALEQPLSIPPGVSATFSFKVWGQYQPTTAFIYIVDQQGGQNLLEQFIAPPLVDRQNNSYVCTSNSFITKTYDISNYAGQNIKVRFEATSSGNDGTFAIFDDVAITIAQGGGSGGGGGNTTTKRSSTVKIICNRSGDLLSATCGATVGDISAPPRTTPTGMVSFKSKVGAPEFSSACQLQPTPYSPGVASCTVPYSPPPGFPVGAAFPLDALYEGDANFNPSATDHQLLMASCIGDGMNPCSNAIGLDFGNDANGILNNSLSLLASCAKISSRRSLRAEPSDASTCLVDTSLEMSIVEELEGLDPGEWAALAEAITNKDASVDPLLREIERIGQLPGGELQSKLSNVLDLAKRLQKANQEYFKKKTTQKRTFSTRNTTLRASKPRVVLNIATGSFTVKNGREKKIALKLDKRARTILAAFKRAGFNQLTVTLKASVKRKNARKARKLKITRDIGLYNY